MASSAGFTKGATGFTKGTTGFTKGTIGFTKGTIGFIRIKKNERKKALNFKEGTSQRHQRRDLL